MTNKAFTEAIELYDNAMKTRDSLEFARAIELFESAQTIMNDLQLPVPLHVAFAYDMALAFDLDGQQKRALELFRKSVELYESFSKSDPDNPAVEGFSGLIWGINDYLSLHENVSEHDDNYLSSITPRPWGQNKMPLKVCVEKSGDTGFDTTLRQIILDGFRAWTAKPSGLTWEETDNPNEASIVVSRVSDLGSGGGHTGFEEITDHEGNRHLQLATIRIALHSPDATVYKDNELRALRSLAIHEAGHALGLDGHSPHATDLMYWKSPLLHLSARDLKTLQLIYS